MFNRVVVALLFGWTVASGGAQAVDFATDVAPILQAHCLRCHKPANRQGDLSLATEADLQLLGYVVPGDPDNSYLLEVVQTDDEQSAPPMPKEGERLTAAQIQVLSDWIKQGATWPTGTELRERSAADRDWWSLQPIHSQRPELPTLPADARTKFSNPIDQFVYARLAAAGLEFAPAADRRTLIRRVTYDLTGLPPSPEQVEQFLADRSPDAYGRLVDRLLASPQYGEHWGRHWLDVVRFGESRGFERNEIVNNAWPFRDYVISAFNIDKPFDQFIREHLAGDQLGPGQMDTAIGTTFLIAGPFDDVGNQDAAQAAQIRANTIDEMIRTTAEAFLGMTLGCARCHDHKFDPLMQEDYYAWYATFAGVHHGERTIAPVEAQEAYQAAIAPLQEQVAANHAAIQEIETQQIARAELRRVEMDAKLVRPPVDRKRTEETFPATSLRYLRLEVNSTDTDFAANTGFGIDEFEVWTSGSSSRNVALRSAGGEAIGTSRTPGDFAKAYGAELTNDGLLGARWIAAEPQLTIRLAQAEEVDRVVFSSDRNGDAGDHPVARFVADYRLLGSLDGEHWQLLADSSDRQPINDTHRRHRRRQMVATDEEREKLTAIRQTVHQLNQQIAAVPALPRWWAGTFAAAPGPFHVFLGGDPQRLGQPVEAKSWTALPEEHGYCLSADTSESERRMRIAEWIVADEHPLTRRVLANRLWHYHFGIGIVDTPSDFGYAGGQPSHPQLLDWLAERIRVHQWQLKPLQRLIVTSTTYCQSSRYLPEAAAIDQDSRLLWRFPPRRLSAEEVRDTLLVLSGELRPSMGGPGYRLYHYMQDNVATYEPLDHAPPETFRRAVYHQSARASHVDVLTDFDCPDSAFSAPRRAATTTPLQALALMNHSFTLEMAAAMSNRLQRLAESANESDDPTVDEITLAYRLAYARKPNNDEVVAARKFVAEHGLPAFCRAIINSNELIYLD